MCTISFYVSVPVHRIRIQFEVNATDFDCFSCCFWVFHFASYFFFSATLIELFSIFKLLQPIWMHHNRIEWKHTSKKLNKNTANAMVISANIVPHTHFTCVSHVCICISFVGLWKWMCNTCTRIARKRKKTIKMNIKLSNLWRTIT